MWCCEIKLCREDVEEQPDGRWAEHEGRGNGVQG